MFFSLKKKTDTVTSAGEEMEKRELSHMVSGTEKLKMRQPPRGKYSSSSSKGLT